MSARPLFLVYAGVSYELDRADLVLPRTYWGILQASALGNHSTFTDSSMCC